MKSALAQIKKARLIIKRLLEGSDYAGRPMDPNVTSDGMRREDTLVAPYSEDHPNYNGGERLKNKERDDKEKEEEAKKKKNKKYVEAFLKLAYPVVFDAKTDSKKRDYINIYRVCNNKGEGPYATFWPNDDDQKDFRKLEKSSQIQPFEDSGFTQEEQDLWNESMRDKRLDLPCAFETEQDYIDWFSPEQRVLLEKNGYTLKRKKAKKIISNESEKRKGKRQVYYEPYTEIK